MEPLNTGDGPAMSESSPPGHCGIFFLGLLFYLMDSFRRGLVR